MKLKKIVGDIRDTGGGVDGPDKVTQDGSLQVSSPATNIVAHTLVHEKQHRQDHLDIIDAMIRPWDTRITTHTSKAKGLKGDHGGLLRSELDPPRTFHSKVEDSGTQFHTEEDGKLPSLAVSVDSVTGAAKVLASPVKVMSAVTPGRYRMS